MEAPVRIVGNPLFKPLFTAPDALIVKALRLLPQALDQVMPLSRAHRADLPDAIRDLSGMLTFERGRLSRSYWGAPRFVSAYLRYFMPWNLVRLTRLLPGLSLPLPETEAPRVLDLGSGPLTLPLALWLARPDWRAAPVTLVCADSSPRPMELGRQVLETVAALLGEPMQWTIRLVRTPFMRAFREVRQSQHLIMAGNVLNELKDDSGTPLDERMADLAGQTGRMLDEQGSALFVEPGTRLGGTLTARLREAAMEEGLVPAAPCPHLGECPLLERRDRRWCHALLEAEAPDWMVSLAAAARLPKDTLSLAFMQLVPGAAFTPPAAFPDAPGRIPARILSEAFPVPGMGMARYACTAEGFAIVPLAGTIPSGALLACDKPAAPRRDAKTGALELHWRAASQK